MQSTIKIRNEYNSMVSQYPIVLGSPNNVEADDEKESIFIGYLLSNSNLSVRFIMSGIGFDTADFRAITNKSMSIITLTNNKYHLLQEDDYIVYSLLMNEMCDAE